jgi:hypothetical protein
MMMLLKNQSYNGIFWLPESTDNKMRGILKIKESYEIELKIFGIFDLYKRISDDEDSPSPEIILGNIEGEGKVTLIDNYGPLKQGYFAEDTRIEDSCFYSNYLITGENYYTKSKVSFKTINVTFTCIEHWTDIDPYHPHYKENLHTLTYIPYKEEYKINLDCLEPGCELNIITFVNRESHGRSSYKLEHQIIFRINVANNKELSWFEKTIRSLSRFFTFLIGIPIFVNEVESISELKDESRIRQINIYSRMFNTGFEEYDFRRVVLPFTFLTNDVNKYFGNWFINYEKLKPALDLYLSNLYHKEVYIEQRFLNLMQALEITHNRIYGNRKLSTPAKKGKIRSTEEYPNLWERIEYLIDFYWQNCLDKFVDRDVFEDLLVKRADFIRNYLTHYDSKKEKIKEREYKTDDKFYSLIMKINKALNLLLVVIFLDLLGVPRDLIYNFTKDNIHFQKINDYLKIS